MRLELERHAALVTGAASGIGAAVAQRLAEEGARVALMDRDATGLMRIADELRSAGHEVIPVVADVTSESEVSLGIASAVDMLGGLDLVVGCAGVSAPMGRRLDDVALAEWNAVFAANVTGSFLLMKHALPALRSSDAAAVVLVASDSALVAVPGMVPYCASKAAVVQLARALSVEVAGDGIRVNAVCPSVVDTPMSRHDLGLTRGFDGVGFPVQTAREVADEIAFLCSRRSRAVNGTALLSDFGYTARSSFPA